MSRLLGTAAKVFAAIVLVVAAMGLNVQRAWAHTPHDDVSDVALSSGFASDRTVFAISDNRPLRSTDGGAHWTEMVRGLTGQNLAAFATAPTDAKVVYLSTRTDGVHRSLDGGSTWQSTNSPPAMRVMSTLAVSPASSRVVVAAAGVFGGLYRTLDGGNRWTVVPGIGKVAAITFVPSHPLRVVIADATAVRISDDDGATFHAASGLTAAVTALSVGTGSSGSTMFAGTSTGKFLISTDAGASWSNVGVGVATHQQIESIAISGDYATDRTLWASTFDRGVYRSTDRGRTWNEAITGLTTDAQAYTYKLPEFQELQIARDSAGRQVLYLAGYDGLFRSSDGANRWESVETLAEYVTGLAVSPNFDVDKTLVVNTYVKGVYISRDGGTVFDASDVGLEHFLSEGNKLLPVRRMHDVVFSPDYAQDRTILTATWDAFVKSTDGGRTWKSIQVSVPKTAADDLRQFVIAVSPAFATDQTVFLGTRQGIVYRSTAGGNAGTWSAIARLDSGVRSIVVSPGFERDHSLFASTANGIVTSTNAGANWTATGLDGISLLAISPGFVTDRILFAGTEHGLYVTRDAGRTWSPVGGGAFSATARIAALAVSPAFVSDGTILASVAGIGLFRSNDHGHSFVSVGESLLDRDLIIADFENPTSEPIQFSTGFVHDRTVFAYAAQSVVRSTDGGETWAVLPIPPASEFRSPTPGANPPASAGAPVATSGNEAFPVVPIAGGAIAVIALVGLIGYRRRRRTKG